MEDNDKTPAATTDTAPADNVHGNAQDAPGVIITLNTGGKVVHRDGRFQSLKANSNYLGNRNSRKHGMRAINQAWRDKQPIDGKSKAGKVERQVFDELVWAFGGGETDRIDVVTQIHITLLAYDCGRWWQHRISKKDAVKQLREVAKKRGQNPKDIPPKVLALLESYEQPTINSLRAGLAALGKPPDKDVPKLQDILDSIAQQGDADGDGGAGSE